MDLITLAMAKKYSDKKGGYTETKKTVLAPPTVVAWVVDGYIFPCLEVTSGMVLDITIDGVTHRGTVTANENYGGMPAVVFDIGDFVYFPDMAMGNVYVNDATENMPDATISVVAVNETIVPIDPKYLPGVCLPVVELETNLLEDSVALSAEDSAKMDRVAVMDVPVVIKLMVGEVKMQAVFCSINGVTFVAHVNGANLTIAKGDSGWIYTIGL